MWKPSALFFGKSLLTCFMGLETGVIRLKRKSQGKAAVWGPWIGQEGFKNCCRRMVQSQRLALPTSVRCCPIPPASTCTASPILGALMLFGRSSSENTVKTPVCFEEGVERNEVKAVFEINHSQKMVYCRDIYEREGRIRSSCMSPPDLLTEVVQGKNQQEKILHLLLENMSASPWEFQLPFDNNCQNPVFSGSAGVNLAHVFSHLWCRFRFMFFSLNFCQCAAKKTQSKKCNTFNQQTSAT